MTNDQLVSFVAVVEAGSFSKAAQRLFMAPQTLMQQIGNMEAELGIKLLERSSKGVRTTPGGAEYYQDARRLIEMFDAAQTRATTAAQGRPAVRFCHCNGRVARNHCLMDIAYELSVRRPDIAQQHLTSKDSPEGDLDSVAHGVFDLIEWIEEPGVARAGLGFTPLAPARPLLLVSRTHPFAQRDAVELEELAGYRISCSNPYWFSALAADLAIAAPDARLENHACDETGIANVCMNLGVFLVWDIVSSDVAPDLACVELPSIYASQLGLVHVADPSPEVRAALSVAREMFPKGSVRG